MAIRQTCPTKSLGIHDGSGQLKKTHRMHAEDAHPARIAKIELTMEPYTEISRNKSARQLSVEFIEAVRELSPIESVAGEYVEFRKSGAQLVGLCPFHAERTPSFYVHPIKGAFFCHGCGSSGDVFDFTKLVLGCRFWQAVNYLAARARISKDSFRPTPQLRERVALLAAHRNEERKFGEFCDARINAINARHRSLGHAATNAEICLQTGKLLPDEAELAWDALERYVAFAARVEREDLCGPGTLRREWLTRREQRGRSAA
jgi:hypothetical protein